MHSIPRCRLENSEIVLETRNMMRIGLKQIGPKQIGRKIVHKKTILEIA